MKFRYIALGILASATLFPVFTSCSEDFLKEELTTQRNTDYFNTNEGIEALEVGLYDYLRFYVCSETGYSTMNYGTDEYSVGADASNGMWNDYSAKLAPSVAIVNSNTASASSLWDYMYMGINNANTIIDRVVTNKVYTGNNGDRLAGMAYFMRGFHYYNLVTQYGGVPIKLEPSASVEFEFERSTTAETFAQVEADLLEAYKLLPENASRQGEITKSAAAHFLAKAYLWRASELNDSWNSSTKDQDLSNVITYANYVIQRHPLADNFKDLWDYTGPNSKNESNPEVVLASQFTDDSSTWNVGGAMFFYCTSQYQNLPGMKRDVTGGREYNRLRTTYYSVYQYDLLNDSRFWKTFRTKMNMCNNISGTDFVPGQDRGLMYILNQEGDDRFKNVRNEYTTSPIYDAELNRPVGTTFVFMPKGASREDRVMELPGNNGNFWYFPMNTKYNDGSRNSIADSHCFRDGIIARSAEDYFLLAEAYIRQGKYGDATNTLNIIRKRAAWKAGEDRAEHVDGSQAWVNSEAKAVAVLPGITTWCDRNSYYESNNIAFGSLNAEASDLSVSDISKLANLPAEDQYVCNKLGASSEYDVALCFLLNEKSREMSLEFVRWVDLARTKTLIKRVKAFNTEAAENIEERHYLRPIPQTYLDVLKRDGKALTPQEKDAIQNPGY